MLFITFTRWHIKQTFNIPLTFPKKFLRYLDEELKIILGYASFTKTDNRYGLAQQGIFYTLIKLLKKLKINLIFIKLKNNFLQLILL